MAARILPPAGGLAALHNIRVPEYLCTEPPGSPAMLTVTAAEFRRHLGCWQERACHQRATVTRHGRESLVLLSAKEYRRLKRLDREPLSPDEAEMDCLAVLAGAGEGDGRITGADHDRALYGNRDG